VGIVAIVQRGTITRVPVRAAAFAAIEEGTWNIREAIGPYIQTLVEDGLPTPISRKTFSRS
jgi:hypothetical protein